MGTLQRHNDPPAAPPSPSWPPPEIELLGPEPRRAYALGGCLCTGGELGFGIVMGLGPKKYEIVNGVLASRQSQGEGTDMM